MHPLLFQVGPVPIHTYGVALALGFLLCLLVVRFLARRSNLDSEKIIDLVFVGLFFGFLGARILFVITRWETFLEDPAMIYRVWEGGFVFYGGLVLVTPLAILWLRRNKMDPWLVGDVAMPGLVLAHAIGRLGCFASGCCYGSPTHLAWGVSFDSPLVEPLLRGIPLHPTQIYEAVALFVLFLGMLWIFKSKFFNGQVLLSYFLTYPIIRSVIEIFRGDVVRGFIVDDVLSTSQFISILIWLGAWIALFYRMRSLKLPAKLDSPSSHL